MTYRRLENMKRIVGFLVIAFLAVPAFAECCLPVAAPPPQCSQHSNHRTEPPSCDAMLPATLQANVQLDNAKRTMIHLAEVPAVTHPSIVLSDLSLILPKTTPLPHNHLFLLTGALLI
jgi:hypothetical protein